MTGKRIVWDWNGTLLDDLDLCNGVLNDMLAKRGVPPVSRKRYKEIFTFPVSDYYQTAGFDFDREPFPVLAEEFMALYGAGEASCPIHAGLTGLITALDRAGYRQEILSATRQEELILQVESRGIAGFFERISGTGTILAHGKSGLARAWTERYRDKEETLWFVGDTPHDAEVARIMGAECLLVAWGHVSRERLLTAGDPVFDTPEKLQEFWGI